MRTEEQVLKDFEVLDYKFYKFEDIYHAIKREVGLATILIIYTSNQYYDKYEEYTFKSIPVTLQEHKLLNELFQIWNWL